MKNILLVIMAVATLSFIGCGKGDDSQATPATPTTYTLIYELDGSSSVTVDLILFEYNDLGETIQNYPMKDAQYGDTKEFIAHDNTTKVKVYVKVSSGVVTSTRLVQQVFYLKKNGNTDILLTNETIVGSEEP